MVTARTKTTGKPTTATKPATPKVKLVTTDTTAIAPPKPQPSKTPTAKPGTKAFEKQWKEINKAGKPIPEPVVDPAVVRAAEIEAHKADRLALVASGPQNVADRSAQGWKLYKPGKTPKGTTFVPCKHGEAIGPKGEPCDARVYLRGEGHTDKEITAAFDAAPKLPKVDTVRTYSSVAGKPWDHTKPDFCGIVYFEGDPKPVYHEGLELRLRDQAMYKEIQEFEAKQQMRWTAYADKGESWESFKRRGCPTDTTRAQREAAVKPQTEAKPTLIDAGNGIIVEVAPKPTRTTNPDRPKGSDLKKEVLTLLHTEGPLTRQALVRKTGVEKGWSKLLGAHTKGDCPKGTMIGDGLITVEEKEAGSVYVITKEGSKLIGK